VSLPILAAASASRSSIVTVPPCPHGAFNTVSSILILRRPVRGPARHCRVHTCSRFSVTWNRSKRYPFQEWRSALIKGVRGWRGGIGRNANTPEPKPLAAPVR
jgi:hypothetical protein